MVKAVPESKLKDAVNALKAVRRDWLRREGVTAVDVGLKIKDGKLTDEVSLRMHVRRKKPLDTLSKHEAATAKAGEKLSGFAVDVIEAEYGPADQLGAPAAVIEAEEVDRRGRVSPLVGGISCGNPRISAGTLGAIVFDRTNGDACILSNWHVLCGSSSCTPGEAIRQPGGADGGTAADTVATLTRSRLESDADAAIARLDGSRTWSRDLLGLNPIPGTIEPTLGMQVSKSGRTTGNTVGIIDGLALSTTINYGGGVVQSFQNQIHILPRPPWPAKDYELSKGGDSGSVWIDDATGKAVGLHFAGETDPSPTAENAIANRMVDVAQELNFQFTPLFSPPDRQVDERLRRLIRLYACRRYPRLCDPAWFGADVGALRGASPDGGPQAAPLACPHCGSGPDDEAGEQAQTEGLMRQILALVEAGR